MNLSPKLKNKLITLSVVLALNLYNALALRTDLLLISAVALLVAKLLNWLFDLGYKWIDDTKFAIAIASLYTIIMSLVFLRLDNLRVIAESINTGMIMFALGLLLSKDDDNKPKKRFQKAVNRLKKLLTIPGVMTQPVS